MSSLAPCCTLFPKEVPLEDMLSAVFVRHRLSFTLELALESGLHLAICFSLISSRVLQSMQRMAVGRASSRFMPISIPQLSQ